MENEIIISKDAIKDFEQAVVNFNDAWYIIKTDLITDIRFVAAQKKRSGKLLVVDGYIEFAAEAAGLYGVILDNYLPEDPRSDADFLTRIKQGVDIHGIVFSAKEKGLSLDLPCNPLRDCEGNVVEYSDCSSYKLSEGGAIRICVGKSSECVKRERIIYSDVVEGWGIVLGTRYRPDLLRGRITNLRVHKEKIGIEFEIFNKKCPVNSFELYFEDYTIYSFNLSLEMSAEDDLEIERMVNGNIFFRLKRCGICIECPRVSVFYIFCVDGEDIVF